MRSQSVGGIVFTVVIVAGFVTFLAAGGPKSNLVDMPASTAAALQSEAANNREAVTGAFAELRLLDLPEPVAKADVLVRPGLEVEDASAYLKFQGETQAH